MGSCCQTKSLNWPKLPNPFLEVVSLQQTPEFQNSFIREIVPLWLLSRWWDRFLVLLTPSSPKPPPWRHFCWPRRNSWEIVFLVTSQGGDRRQTQGLCVCAGEWGWGRGGMSDNLSTHKAGSLKCYSLKLKVNPSEWLDLKSGFNHLGIQGTSCLEFGLRWSQAGMPICTCRHTHKNTSLEKDISS